MTSGVTLLALALMVLAAPFLMQFVDEAHLLHLGSFRIFSDLTKSQKS